MNIPFAEINKNSYQERDRKIIDEWQNRAIELVEQEDFRMHPVTIKLAKLAQEQIIIIENELLTNENIKDNERKALFKEKKAHQFYLKLFTQNGSQELEMIAKRVKEEI